LEKRSLSIQYRSRGKKEPFPVVKRERRPFTCNAPGGLPKRKGVPPRRWGRSNWKKKERRGQKGERDRRPLGEKRNKGIPRARM